MWGCLESDSFCLFFVLKILGKLFGHFGYVFWPFLMSEFLKPFRVICYAAGHSPEKTCRTASDALLMMTVMKTNYEPGFPNCLKPGTFSIKFIRSSLRCQIPPGPVNKMSTGCFCKTGHIRRFKNGPCIPNTACNDSPRILAATNLRCGDHEYRGTNYLPEPTCQNAYRQK